MVFYLNDEWDANWGGELVVYENGEPKNTVMPKRNRLAVINGSYHKVSPNLNQSVDRLTLQTFVVKPKSIMCSRFIQLSIRFTDFNRGNA